MSNAIEKFGFWCMPPAADAEAVQPVTPVEPVEGVAAQPLVEPTEQVELQPKPTYRQLAHPAVREALQLRD